MSKRKLRTANFTREWVVISVIRFVALRRHSGVTHYYIGVIFQVKTELVSSKWALVYCQVIFCVERKSGSASAADLALP